MDLVLQFFQHTLTAISADSECIWVCVCCWKSNVVHFFWSWPQDNNPQKLCHTVHLKGKSCTATMVGVLYFTRDPYHPHALTQHTLVSKLTLLCVIECCIVLLWSYSHSLNDTPLAFFKISYYAHHDFVFAGNLNCHTAALIVALICVTATCFER